MGPVALKKTIPNPVEKATQEKLNSDTHVHLYFAKRPCFDPRQMRYLRACFFVCAPLFFSPCRSLAQTPDPYQVGDAFSRTPVSIQNPRIHPLTQKIARGLGTLRGATAVFLGSKEGIGYFSTAWHVCAERNSCVGSQIQTEVSREPLRVVETIYSDPSIEFTLLKVVPESRNSRIFSQLIAPSFSEEIKKGMPLVIFGYGGHKNPNKRLTQGGDAPCRVLSKTNEMRLVFSPNDLNQTGKRTWSLSVGCDLSPGDSGAPVFSKETAKVIGFVWTGKIPKLEEVQSDKRVFFLSSQNHPKVWSEFNYIVPVKAINQALKKTGLGRLE